MIDKTLVLLATPILAGGMHPNVAPQGGPRPYGVYTEIISPTENTLSDGVPIQQSVLQIDIWAVTYGEAKAAGEALAAALEAANQADTITCLQNSRRGRFDELTKLHGFTYEYSFWYH